MSPSKSSLSRFSIHSTVFLAALSARGPMLAGEVGKAGDKVFVGYLYGQPRDILFQLYTHLCHAFLVADGDGNLRPSRSVPSPGLVREAHKSGVKVLVSLG